MKHTHLKYAFHRWTIAAVMIFTFFNLQAAEQKNTKINQDFTVDVMGKGSSVILIPGLMSNGTIWQGIASKLADKHQVHIISIAGFAGTPKTENFSLTEIKQQLLTYIKNNHLEKPTIIGHSLGGFMGFWLATSTPSIIGDIISVDGLPYIGPIFTRTNDSTVESLAGQAEYIRNLYNNMDQNQLAAQTQQGIFVQATSKESQDHIIDMASKSDPKTVGNSIYTLMNTDLRSEIHQIKGKVLLIGASGAFIQQAQHQQVEALYKQQLIGLPNAQLVMNTQDRHFIMLDNEQWLLEEIRQFIENN